MSDNIDSPSTLIHAQMVRAKQYEEYTQCNNCTSTSINKLLDDDGTIVCLVCSDCGEPFGFDDSTPPDVMIQPDEQGDFIFKVGCCSNTSLAEFVIEKKSGEEIWVKCQQCKNISHLPDGLLMKTQKDEEYEMDVADYICCKCHATEKDIRIVKGEDGDIEMIGCATCNFLYLPKWKSMKDRKQVTTGGCMPTAGDSKQPTDFSRALSTVGDIAVETLPALLAGATKVWKLIHDTEHGKLTTEAADETKAGIVGAVSGQLFGAASKHFLPASLNGHAVEVGETVGNILCRIATSYLNAKK